MVNKKGITVIDLFCGGGGFSEGFHQAGFDVVFGIDNWRPACETHEMNGLGETGNIDLLDFGVDDVLNLKKDLERRYGTIDIVIGSPPCTEFSFAKKGGRGDIEKGMILVRRHLLFVTLFRPKYWLMENVPHLEKTLDDECKGSRQKGWSIEYERLGIPRSQFKRLDLKGESLIIPSGNVFTASDYGTCENRQRFIAGEYPTGLMENQKADPSTDVSLGGLLQRLYKNIRAAKKSGLVADPNYPHHKVRLDRIRDYDYDTALHPMYWEEMRHLKRRHIQYGRMQLPENLRAPARTIMATYNPSSRESMILETKKSIVYQGSKRKVYRQPMVREVACIQGFPLDFQMASSRINNRYKLIGNAVPCQLSYALAKAISQDIQDNILKFQDEDFRKRCQITLRRQKKNDFRPIMPRPKEIIEEAEDIKNINNFYKAKEKKRIRRPVLSSSLYGDSALVVMENTDVIEEKITGGIFWKSCVHKGSGKMFHQIFFDETSVQKIITSMNSSLHTDVLKEVLRGLLKEFDKGMPMVKTDWVEFPGWTSDFQRHLLLIGKKRFEIPDLTMFQKMFTTNMPKIGSYIGPIDFFDGLDAIMLSIFSNKRYRHLANQMVLINKIYDAEIYPHRTDPRIVPRLDNVRFPIVTIMSGLLSVHALTNMYKKTDGTEKNPYRKSLLKAEEKILSWCCY
jgi:site-specific DNA-cytosine methylase